MNPVYGKHRGKVTDVSDPEKKGQIKVKVPNVFEGDQWALPAFPYAGSSIGFYAIPPVDTNVWVEFEDGNTEKPIWTGCFWITESLPGAPADPDVKILKTANTTITLSDKQGEAGITIETSDGAKIVIDSNGIELNNGQGAVIKLESNQVKVNDGALEVT